MAAYRLYCKHVDCSESHDVVGGFMPPICSGCKRDSSWTTEPTERHVMTEPMKRYELWENDKKFLKSIRIEP